MIILEIETQYSQVSSQDLTKGQYSSLYGWHYVNQDMIHRWLLKVRLHDESKRDYIKYFIDNIQIDKGEFVAKRVDTKDNKQEFIWQITSTSDKILPFQINFMKNTANLENNVYFEVNGGMRQKKYFNATPYKAQLSLKVPKHSDPTSQVHKYIVQFNTAVFKKYHVGNISKIIYDWSGREYPLWSGWWIIQPSIW